MSYKQTRNVSNKRNRRQKRRFQNGLSKNSESYNMFNVLNENEKNQVENAFEKAQRKHLAPKPNVNFNRKIKGNWLMIAKAPKPTKQQKPMMNESKKQEVAIEKVMKVSKERKRVKKEEKKKELPTPKFLKPFSKKKVTFADLEEKFTNTDSWGSDEDDF